MNGWIASRTNEHEPAGSPVIETPVLIVGGGPIGLALAADLGRRGVAALLVEKSENKLGPAKMLEVSVRTMEFCRQLGIADKVRNWGFPLDWPLDSAFVTDLQGYELGRVRTPSLGAATQFRVQPGAGPAVPADLVRPDPAGLRALVSAHHLRHQVELESFVQDSDGVTATLRDQRQRPRSKPCVPPISSAATASPRRCASCSASKSAASRISTGR